MSCGTVGWLSWLPCATTVLIFHTFGWDSGYIKRVIFGLFVALQSQPETTGGWILDLSLKALQYAVITLIVIQVARCFLATTDTPGWPGQGKILLFPCRTTHSRLFPEKHSFAYSYLVVGVPVGWEGVSGGMVSSSSTRQPRFSLSRGWYHIDAADYLERGDGHLGLRGKLDAFLKSQAVDPASYPHAYLITAARFLGYHFNPASFWYLYSADMSLAAMIIEVNNTFDERRMYFLTPAQASVSGDIEDSEAVKATADHNTSSTPVFKQTWPKDFHVSPFNSRKGSYSLLASDPLKALLEGRNQIDTTITLKSSKGHGKVVARLVSDGHAIDPASMTTLQKAQFLLSWCWVGFITFPRIAREAGRLWFQRKLHVWYKPEPQKESIGRKADCAERKLEIMFRRYLRSLVEQSQAALGVKYIPSGISESGKELMLSPLAKVDSDAVEEMEFKVLTPLFYTRFVFYAHDLEALFSELRESCTIWVSRPDLLPKLVFKKPTPSLEARSPMDYFFFEAIRYLRQRPERIVRPLTSSDQPVQASPTVSMVDIRDFRISCMDAFILSQEDARVKKQYRRLVLRLFLAKRLPLESLFLFDGILIMLSSWLAWTVAFAWEGSMRVVGLAAAVWAYGYE